MVEVAFEAVAAVASEARVASAIAGGKAAVQEAEGTGAAAGAMAATETEGTAATETGWTEEGEEADMEAAAVGGVPGETAMAQN